MSCTYNISDKNNLVRISHKNLFTIDKVKRYIRAIIKNPYYNPTYNFLIDLRDIKYTPLVSEMYELAEYITSIKTRCTGNAAIVTENEVHHYLFKLSTVFASGKLKSRVFFNPEDALIWLQSP